MAEWDGIVQRPKPYTLLDPKVGVHQSPSQTSGSDRLNVHVQSPLEANTPHHGRLYQVSFIELSLA